MKRFGFINGGYWMILTSIESALDNWGIQLASDFIEKQLASGKVLLVNDMGGYHCSDIDELIDVHDSVDFPKFSKRVEPILMSVESSLLEDNTEEARRILGILNDGIDAIKINQKLKAMTSL